MKRSQPKNYFLKNRWRLLAILCGLVLVVSISVLLLSSWRSPQQLSDALSAMNPHWSPDGTSIVADCAFRYDDAWDVVFAYEVCLAKPDFSGLIRLAPHYIYWQSLAPTWSPSGAELVFVRPQGGLLISTLRSGTTRLLTEAQCTQPAWSPDERRIACISGSDTIIVLQVGTGHVTRLTVPDDPSSLRWTKNNTAIILVKATSLDPLRSAISMLDLTTSKESRLVDDVAPGGQVTLSPDGTHLAYPNGVHTGLEVLNLHTGAREDILAAYHACLESISHPEWFPDGRYLAVAAERHGSSSGGQIYLVDVQSRAVFQLTNFAEGVPAEYLGTSAWSPDTAFLATHTGSARGSQHFGIAVVSTSTAKLTPVNCQ